MRKYEAIITEIKTLSDLQRVLKPQRKLNYEGVTTPGNVSKNKYELRHLFQAYAILKGIEIPIPKKPSNYNGWTLDHIKLNEMVKKFRPVEELAQ